MANSSLPPRFHSKQVKCTTLESDVDCCSILSQSFDILYCNAAWDDFARANGGTEAALSRYVIGRNLLEFLPSPLQPFFLDHLNDALAGLCMWDHFYECSSPDEFRIYRLQALPLPDAAELLMCHSLMHNGPHFRAPTSWKQENGAVRMCCHCRRATRPVEAETWVWAPELLAQPPKRRLDELCPECSRYYDTGRPPWPEHVWKPPSWAGTLLDTDF